MGDAAPSERRSWRERSLAQLTFVRLKEFIREPDAVFWTFGFPILLSVGLGIAFRNRPAETTRVGVVGTGAHADSVQAWVGRGKELAVERFPSDSVAREALRSGRIALVAVVGPPANGSDAVNGPVYVYDDTRPDARTARLIVDDALQRGAGRRDPVETGERIVRDRGSRYIDFVVPGLLAMNIMGGGIWGLGFTIVDARRRHLLKRLVATPMSRAEYLLSFILSRLGFLIIELVIVLGFAALVFRVPMRGSFIQLGVIGVAASLAFSGLGLLVASRARTLESASGLMNVVMMPMWVLSGIFFSASNFPGVVQPFIQALPLTATIDALRGTMLQGVGWGAILPELAIVAAWMVGSFYLALRLFRWR
jgi:ABC-type polysaccharide/polyol phosphate export permease